MRLQKLIGLLLLVCSVQLMAAPPDTKALRAKLDAFLHDPGMRNGQLGFALYDVQSGEMLEQERANETFLPASTLKTVTSAAALGILGPEYKFKTVLEHDGKVEGGVLLGNLIIKGGGDPSLGSDRYKWGTDMASILAAWVKALQDKGITKVQGKVIGDASIFEDADLPTTWVWSDIGNYYGAGASGLSFNENTYVLYFKPGNAVGDVAEFLRTEPAMPDITFVNEMRTGSRSSGDNGFVYGAPFTYVRHLRGTVPMGDEFSIKGSIPEPALFAAQSLKAALEQAGIQVVEAANTERLMRLAGQAPAKERTVLYTHQSPPLKEIIYWLNKKSVNLYAEHLLKMMGQVKYKDGSTDSGVKAVENYWSAKGLDVGGMHLNDGSGLSRYNGITPAQLAGMLRLNVNEPWFEHFWNSLPVAGDSNDPGTLRSMCKGTAAEGKVHAKSGYISRVRTYAGYVDTRSGQRLAFAMLANNYTCTNAQIKSMLEGLMVTLAEM